MPFVKGKSGNPKGRPVKQVNYLGAILSTTTEEDVVEVFQKLLIKAKSGDIAATKIVLEYLAGKPAQQVDVTSNGLTIAPTVINFVDDGEPESEIPTAMETED